MLVNDPKTYREMSVPHASRDALMEDVRLFTDAVAELRRKHKLRDVHVIIRSAAICQDTEGEFESDATITMHLGAKSQAALMLAEALGNEEKEHEEHLAQLRARRRERR